MPLVLEQTWRGRRVVIRRAVSGGFSDVIGVLTAWDGQRARLQSAAGPVSVEADEIAYARLVEPAARDILALEVVAAAGWPAREQVSAHGWLLRANDGFSGRANSALALRAPTPDLGAALAGVRAWYAARGLPALIAVPLPTRRALDAALERLGWPVTTEAVVLAANLPADPTAPNLTAGAAAVHLAPELDDAWLAAYHHDSGPAPELARELLSRPPLTTFARTTVDGQVVAIGRGVLEGGWLGLSAIAVDPEHRRRGLARAIVAALSAWGAAGGATQRYLQVEAANAGAIALYRGLGFWEHHRYRYRRDPAAGPGASPTIGP
jgi:ribosomal protein S18 acetylase RimI-like enzyme